MPDYASPGSMTAARAQFEKDLDAAAHRAMRAFLSEVLSEARSARESALTAAATNEEPPPHTPVVAATFTLGAVAHRWTRFVEAMGRAAEEALERLHVAEARAAAFADRLRRRLYNADTPGKVFAAAREALSEGQSLDVVLHGDNWSAEATMHARTEGTRAFNEHLLDVFAERESEWKQWVAHHDGRTRDTHLAVDGTIVPLSGTFTVGGWAMMAPGDPAAPAEETANCRCTMIAKRKPRKVT